LLKRNIISNFLGNGYVVILQFALVPFLLKYLGAEAYGLVGIYVTLLAALNMLDMGLSPALSRELARLSVLPNSAHLMRSTLTTLECIYFAIALLIINIFYFGAPLIAKYWLNSNALPIETISTCLRLMGFQCALQFLTNYYTNGLIGLQYMVRANGVLALNHTLRVIAGLFVLIVGSASVQVYFLSQVMFTFVGLLVTVFALYRALPVASGGGELTLNLVEKFKLRFNLERFNACKRFAIGMAITSVLTFFIMQTDKIILSKLVTLEQFGYYTVAVNIAMMIGAGAALISRSVLPRMTQLVAVNDTEALKTLYLKASASVAWVVLPIAGLLIAFNHQFLTMYLGNPERVMYVAPIFKLLMAGYAIHSLMYVPYALSLAYGWTRYGINVSIVALIAMTPITAIATIKYGVMGAAGAWLVLSIGYFVFSMLYLHRRCLPKILSRWYVAVISPIVFSTLIVIVGFIFN
jgi:O-antigen/teichoic acid export membrane protein